MTNEQKTFVADFAEVETFDWGEAEKSSRDTDEALVLVGLEAKEDGGRKRLSLTFKDLGPVKVVVDKPHEQFLRIDKKVIITFQLDQSEFAWAFDFKHKAFTLKLPPEAPKYENYKDCYKVGRSKDGDPTKVVVESTPRPNPDPKNPDVEVHPFNFWVLMEQPGNRPPLPVRIDPDIKNPPPPPDK